MNKAAFVSLQQYQRLFRKMHGTILYVRIIPAVILSFACILLLFLAIVFGMSIPLLLQLLAKSCLLALCTMASCYLFWEKVVERPKSSQKKTLFYCLISETILPVITLILAAVFIAWPLLFLALFPIAFGLSLFWGKTGRKFRLSLVWIQIVQLCLTTVFSVLYVLEMNPATNIYTLLAILICVVLYLMYGLRRAYLLCNNTLFAPITLENVVTSTYFPETVPETVSKTEQVLEEEVQTAWREEPGDVWDDEVEDVFWAKILSNNEDSGEQTVNTAIPVEEEPIENVDSDLAETVKNEPQLTEMEPSEQDNAILAALESVEDVEPELKEPSFAEVSDEKDNSECPEPTESEYVVIEDIIVI